MITGSDFNTRENDVCSHKVVPVAHKVVGREVAPHSVLAVLKFLGRNFYLSPFNTC